MQMIVVDKQPLDTTTDQKLSKREKRSKAISISNSTGLGKSSVIYVGRIPHGFYEDQMRGIVLLILQGMPVVFFRICCYGYLGDILTSSVRQFRLIHLIRQVSSVNLEI